MKGRHGLTASVAFFSTAIVVAACGIPIDEAATPIDPETVEYELLATTTSTTSTTVVEAPRIFVNFYWHGIDNRLAVVPKGRETNPSPQETLQELVAGPLETDLEESPDLVTLLDDTMEPVLISPETGDVYRIQINRAAAEVLTTDQAAEFVCTVTQFDEIGLVEIIDLEGELYSLSGFGAVALNGPAKASDFGDCEPEPLVLDDPADDPDDDTADSSTTTTTTSG